MNGEGQEEVGGKSPSPYNPSVIRLWRPAAQRNLRNQWSRIVAGQQKWVSASADGRSHASSLVNLYLSRKYMPAMDLGVLGEMTKIKDKACAKLARQEELCWIKLSASYRNMVAAISLMLDASRSMRCFLKGPAGTPIVQFSFQQEHGHDTGDGDGIPVFSFLAISFLEALAQEIVQMFRSELFLKRLLLVEFCSISFQAANATRDDKWSKEIYEGEFDDLNKIGLFSGESCVPAPPSTDKWKLDKLMAEKSDTDPKREVLQVYLTAWLAEVNISSCRIDEIISMVEEEMKVRLA
ncbi:uncharacterized protein LOC116256728 [Nymphaea colorata]|nr:uncharacterized protein LOC116256728 [Nymphaea colorata]